MTKPTNGGKRALQSGQKSCGQLKRFYVKQVESGDAGEFDRMSDDELREFIAEQDKILAALEAKTKH